MLAIMEYAKPIIENATARPSGLSWANAQRLATDIAQEIARIESEAWAAVERGERLTKRSPK